MADLDNLRDHFVATRSAFSAWERPSASLTHGRGAWVYDSQGRRYLDFASGSGSLILGHGDAGAAAVLAEQAARIAVYPGTAFCVAAVEEYLEVLAGFAGGAFSRVLLASSGSDAVEAACKLALQYQQVRGAAARRHIIGRAGSYHGNSLYALGIGGFFKRRAPFELVLPRLPRAAAAFCYRCQFDSIPESCALQCARSVEEAIEATGPENVAAVILEPIVGAALSGAVPDPRYLTRVRAICDKYQVLLIADEVLSGFARTGRPFAWHHWSVQPDILIAGKAISGGYFPLSAVVATDRVVEPLREAHEYLENGQTHLFSPVGAALGKYVMERVIREDLAGRADRAGEVLRGQLAALLRYDLIGDVRGLGLLIGIELVKDARSKANFSPPGAVARQFAEAARRAGLIVYPSSGGPDSMEGEHVLLLPPLTIEEEEIEFARRCLELAVRDCTHLAAASA